jgi:hypothetical protein
MFVGISYHFRQMEFFPVLQLIFIFVGLWSAIPFMLTSEQTDIHSLSLEQWTGNGNALKPFEGLLGTGTNIQNFKHTVILGQTLYLLSI